MSFQLDISGLRQNAENAAMTANREGIREDDGISPLLVFFGSEDAAP